MATCCQPCQSSRKENRKKLPRLGSFGEIELTYMGHSPTCPKRGTVASKGDLSSMTWGKRSRARQRWSTLARQLRSSPLAAAALAGTLSGGAEELRYAPSLSLKAELPGRPAGLDRNALKMLLYRLGRDEQPFGDFFVL